MGQLGVSGEDLERLGAPTVVIFKGMGSFQNCFIPSTAGL